MRVFLQWQLLYILQSHLHLYIDLCHRAYHYYTEACCLRPYFQAPLLQAYAEGLFIISHLNPIVCRVDQNAY
jgi:hypothetical protein